MRELTFNLTEDKRYLVEPTNVENFNLTFDKPNWVQGRVGEDSLRQVFVNVVTGPNNEPYDLTGINPEFDGLTAKGGPEHRNYVVIDNHHSVMIDAQGGRFRFDFPKEAFAIAGSYKQAFFSLKREGTGEVVATLEFDMKVMANFVYENVVAFDYVTPFEDLYHQLEQIIETANGDITSKLTEWQTNFQNKYNELQQLGIHTTDLLTEVQSRLNDLAEQIESKDLMTKTQAMSILNSHDARIQSIEHSALLYFEDLNSLKSANLSAGQLVVVRGGDFSGDGGEQYVIESQSKTGSIQLQNGKYARKVVTSNNTYYGDEEVSVSNDAIDGSIISKVKINRTDLKGNKIIPFIDSTEGMGKPTTIEYAREKLATVASFAAPWYQGDANGIFHNDGSEPYRYYLPMISNGEILFDLTETQLASLPNHLITIGFDENGDIIEFKSNETTAAELISGGAVNAFPTFGKIIQNGVTTGLNQFGIYPNNTNDYIIPQNIFVEWNDGSYGFVLSTARAYDNFGLTVDEMRSYLLSQPVKNAWILDGGGSASVVVRGIKVSPYIDSTNSLPYSSDRETKAVLSFTKPNAIKSVESQLTSQLSDSFEEFNFQLASIKKYAFKDREINGPWFTLNSDADVQTMLDQLLHYAEHTRNRDYYVITGKAVVNYQNSIIYRNQNDRYRTEAFRYVGVFSSGDMNQWGAGYVTLESVGNYSQRFVTQYSAYSHEWSAWHSLGVIHQIPSVKVLDNTKLSISSFQSTSGIVNLVGVVSSTAVDSSWTKIATGLPIPANPIPGKAVTVYFKNSSDATYGLQADLSGNLFYRNLSGDANASSFSLVYPTKDLVDWYRYLNATTEE